MSTRVVIVDADNHYVRIDCVRTVNVSTKGHIRTEDVSTKGPWC
jgi:hypothetical protein